MIIAIGPHAVPDVAPHTRRVSRNDINDVVDVVPTVAPHTRRVSRNIYLRHNSMR